MQFVVGTLLRDNPMYRKRIQEEEMAETEKQFLTCVGDLPVVNSAWTQLSTIYSKTKAHNPVFHYSLGIAETGLKIVVGTAQPLLDKYDQPIKYVNSVACNQLDHLKETYPVVTKPTEQVIQAGKENCSALIKPTVNRLYALKDFGVNAYTTSTGTVSNVAQAASDYSKNQLTLVTSYGEGVINQALHTPYGHLVNDKVNSVLSMSELYLDKYLPEDTNTTDLKEEGNDNALVHAGHFTSKLRRRMYSKAMRDLVNVKVRSTETLAKLNFTVDLIEYSRSHLDEARNRLGAAQNKLWQTWQEISDESNEDKLDDKQGLEKRCIILARHLLRQLKTNISTLETSMVEMPGTLQEKYKGLQQYTEDMLTSFKLGSVTELPGWMLVQTRNRLSYVESTLTFLTEQAFNTPPLNWMVMDVDLDGLDLQEIEMMWTQNGQIQSVNGRTTQKPTQHSSNTGGRADASI